MKSRVNKVLLLAMAFLITRCFPANAAGSDEEMAPAEGFLVGYTECVPLDGERSAEIRMYQSMAIVGEHDDKRTVEIRTDQSMVIWEYDGEGNLNLHHLNAAFNCCPEFECKVSVDSNVITIREAETGDCDCVCLFDVDYRVTGLTHRSYLVRFEELYLDEDDETIEFHVTLGGQPRPNTFVAYRGHHPWRSDGSVWGKLLNLAEAARLPEIHTYNLPERGNCIVWDYEDNVLRLRHRGAVFNKGIGVLVDIALQDRVLTVREYTHGLALVPAWGPVDLEMRIYNLPPAEYRLELLHPSESFETTVDLLYVPTGNFCPGY